MFQKLKDWRGMAFHYNRFLIPFIPSFARAFHSNFFASSGPDETCYKDKSDIRDCKGV